MRDGRSADPGGSAKMEHAVQMALQPIVSRITAKAVLDVSMRRLRLTAADLDRTGVPPTLVEEIERRLAIYLRGPKDRQRLRESLRTLRRPSTAGALEAPAAAAGAALETGGRIEIDGEQAIVKARGQVRVAAAELGFDRNAQIQVATAVSELARNIHAYAGSGYIEFAVLRSGPPGLRIRAVDAGPGIPNLDEILAGDYRSRTGMGLGIRGCRRLMSKFEISSHVGRGTVVVMEKHR